MTIIEIPDGVGGRNGRRKVELDLVDNQKALALVDRRHIQDAHPELARSTPPYVSDKDFEICAEISKRASAIWAFSHNSG